MDCQRYVELSKPHNWVWMLIILFFFAVNFFAGIIVTIIAIAGWEKDRCSRCGGSKLRKINPLEKPT